MAEVLHTTVGIVHRLGCATGDRNVSRKLLSFMAKTVRYNPPQLVVCGRERKKRKSL